MIALAGFAVLAIVYFENRSNLRQAVPQKLSLALLDDNSDMARRSAAAVPGGAPLPNFLQGFSHQIPTLCG